MPLEAVRWLNAILYTSSHSVYYTNYHIVWVTKYRRKILNPDMCSYL
ncbi:transposase [Vibrio diabolicus]